MAVDTDLLSAILENALDTEDPEELARYRELLEDPEALAVLAESVRAD